MSVCATAHAARRNGRRVTRVNVFTFDIETIPDTDAGRRLYALPEHLDDRDVAQVMFYKRRQQGGGDFLRHHLHRVVAIAVALRSGERFKVWSLGDADADERELLQRFFRGIEEFTPLLVSWNGGGFDLPVLHYRAMLHGVAAPRYWDTGDDDNSFRYNNYLNRFHARHTDLMDVLSGYQPRAAARLDDIATLIGLPGKQGMDGSKVWDAWLDGDIGGIRAYCELDVLNTYLVYLRFEQIRGHLDENAFALECERVRETLTREGHPHFQRFIESWTGTGGR